MSPASPQFRISELIAVLTRLVQSVNGAADNSARRLYVVDDASAVLPDRERLVHRSPERNEVIGVDIHPGLVNDAVAAVRAFLQCVQLELHNRGVSLSELNSMLDEFASLNRVALLSPSTARRLSSLLNHPVVQSVLQQADLRFVRDHADLHARLAAANNPNTPPGGRLFTLRVRKTVLGQELGTGTTQVTHHHVVQGTERQEQLTLRERLELFHRGQEILRHAQRQRPQSLRDLFAQMSRRPIVTAADAPEPVGAGVEALLHASVYNEALERAKSLISDPTAARVAAEAVVESHLFGEQSTELPNLSGEELFRLQQITAALDVGTISDPMALERVMVSTAVKIQAGQEVSEQTFIRAVREALSASGIEFGAWAESYLGEVYRHLVRSPQELVENRMSLLSLVFSPSWRHELASELLSQRYHPLVVYWMLRSGGGDEAQHTARMLSALVDEQQARQWIERETAFLDQLVQVQPLREDDLLPRLRVSQQVAPHPVPALAQMDETIWQSVVSSLPDRQERVHPALRLYLTTVVGWHRYRSDQLGELALDPRETLSALTRSFELFTDLFGDDQAEMPYAVLAIDRALLETMMLRRAGESVSAETIVRLLEFHLQRFGVRGVEDLSAVVDYISGHLQDGSQYGVSERLLQPHALLDLLRSGGHPAVSAAYMLLRGVSPEEARAAVQQAAASYRLDSAELDRLVRARMRFLTRLAEQVEADASSEVSAVLRTLLASLRGDDMEWRLRVLREMAHQLQVEIPQQVARLLDMPLPPSGGAGRYTGRVLLLLPGGPSGFRAFSADVRDMPLTDVPFELEAPRDPLSPRHFSDQELALQRLLAHVLAGHPVVLPESQFNRLVMNAHALSELYEAFHEAASQSVVAESGAYASGRHVVSSDVLERARNLLEFWVEGGDVDESTLVSEDPYAAPPDLVSSWNRMFGLTDEVVYRRRIGRGRSQLEIRRGVGGIRRDVVPESLLEYRAHESEARARALQSAMERLERLGEYTAVGPGGRLVQVLGTDDVDAPDRLRVRDWTLEEFLRKTVGDQFVLSLPGFEGRLSMILTSRDELVKYILRHSSLAIFIPDTERLVPMFWSVEGVMSQLVREHPQLVQLAKEINDQFEGFSAMSEGEIHLLYGDLYRATMAYRRGAAYSEQELQRLQESVDAVVSEALSEYADMWTPADLGVLKSYIIAGLPGYAQEGTSFAGYVFNRFVTGALARRIGGVHIAEPGLLAELSRTVSEQMLSEYGTRSDVVLLHTHAVQLAQRLGLPRDRDIMQALYRFLYKSFAYHTQFTMRIEGGLFEELFGVPRERLDFEVEVLRHGAGGELLSVAERPVASPVGSVDQPEVAYWSGHEQMLEALGFSAPEGLFGVRRRRFLTVFGWQLEMGSEFRQSVSGAGEQFVRLMEQAVRGTLSQRELSQLSASVDLFNQYAVDREALEAYTRRGVYDPSYFPVARALYHLIRSDVDTRLSVALRRAYLGTAGGRASDLETLQDLGAAAFAFAAEFVRTTPPGSRISELGGVIMPSDPDEVALFLQQNLLKLMIARALRSASREQLAWEASTRSLEDAVSPDDDDSRTLLEMVTQSLTMQSPEGRAPGEVVEVEASPSVVVSYPSPPSRFAQMMSRFDELSRRLQRSALKESMRELQRQEALESAVDAVLSLGLFGKIRKDQRVVALLSELQQEEVERLAESLAGLQERFSKRDLAALLRHFTRRRPRPPMNYMSPKVLRAMERAERETGNPQRWREYYTEIDARAETVYDFLRFVLGEEGYQRLMSTASERVALSKLLYQLVSDIRDIISQEAEWVSRQLERIESARAKGEITEEEVVRRIRGVDLYLQKVNAEAATLQRIHDYLQRSRIEPDFRVWLEGEYARLRSLRQARDVVGIGDDPAGDAVSDAREAPLSTELVAREAAGAPRTSKIDLPRESPPAHEVSVHVVGVDTRGTLDYLRAVSDLLTDLTEGSIGVGEVARALRGLRLVGVGGHYSVLVPLELNGASLEVRVLPGRRVVVAGRVLALDEVDPYAVVPEAVQQVPQQVERPVDLSQAMPAQVVVQPGTQGQLRPLVRLAGSAGELAAFGSAPYMSFDIEVDPRTGRLLQAGVVRYVYGQPGQDLQVSALRLFLTDAELQAGLPLEETKAYRQLLSLLEFTDAVYAGDTPAQRARRVAEALGMEWRVVARIQRASRSAEEFARNLIEAGALREESRVVWDLAEYLLQQVQGGATPLVQNVAFDVPFIASRLEEFGQSELAQRLRQTLAVERMVDVAEMAVRAGHTQVSLQALGRETGFLVPGERERHLALDDAILAARVAGALYREIEAGAPLESLQSGQYLVGLGPGRLFDISGLVPEQVVGLRDRVFRVVGAGYSTDQQRVSVELEEIAFDESGQPVPLRRLRFEPMMGDQEVHPVWQASLEMSRMFTVVDEQEARRVYALGVQDAFRREVERILAPDLPPHMTVRFGQLPSEYEREGIVASWMTVLRARAVAEGVPQSFSDPREVAAWVRETLGMGEALSEELAVHLGQRAALYLGLQYARDPRRQEVYRRVWEWWTSERRQEVLGSLFERVVGRGLESQLSWSDITWIWRQVIAAQVEEAGLQPESIEVPAYRQQVMHVNFALARGGFATIAVPTDLPQATQEAMILHRVRTQLRRQLLEGVIGEGDAVSSARADVLTLLAMSEGGAPPEAVQRAMELMAQRRLAALQLRDVAQRIELAGEATPEAFRLERLREQLSQLFAQSSRGLNALADVDEQRLQQLMRMRPLQLQAELGRNAQLRELLDEYILRVALPVDTVAAEMSQLGVVDAVWQVPDISAARAMDAVSSVLRPPPPGQTERVPVERLVPREVSGEQIDRLWQSAVRQARAMTAAQRLQRLLEGLGVQGYRVTQGDLSAGVPMHSAVVALHRALSEAADRQEQVLLSDVTARMRQILGADQVTIGRYHTLNLQNPNAAYEFVQYLMRTSGWIRRYADVVDEEWLSWANEQLSRLYRLEFGRAKAFAQRPYPSYIEAPVTTPLPEAYMEWVVRAWNELNAGLDSGVDAPSGASVGDRGAGGSSRTFENPLFRTDLFRPSVSDAASIFLASFGDDLLIGATVLGGYLFYRLWRKRQDDDESEGGRVSQRTVGRGTAVAGSSRFVVHSNQFRVQPGHHLLFDSDYRMPSPYRLRRMERDMEGLL